MRLWLDVEQLNDVGNGQFRVQMAPFQNNLGGHGPDNASAPQGIAPEGIRYVNVGTVYDASGTPANLDLVLTAQTSGYVAHDPSMNRLNGKFAQINLAANEEVEVA